MGNKHQILLRTALTERQLQQAIHLLMNLKEGDKISFSNIHKALEYVYLHFREKPPFQKLSDKHNYYIDSVFLQISYHENCNFVLKEMIKLFISESKFMLNKISYFVQTDDWLFLKLLINFIILFSNKKLLQSAQQIVEQKTQNSIMEVVNGRNPTYVLDDYPEKLKLFESIRKIIQDLKKIQNGILGTFARKQTYLSEIIQSSFVLYLQIYFDSNEQIKKSVHENYTQNLQMATYVLALSLHYQNEELAQCCIIFIESMINQIKQQLPPKSPVKLYGFEKIPVNKTPTIYHQILLILIFSLTTNQVLDESRVLLFCRMIVRRIKIQGDHKILYYLDQICMKTNMQSLDRVLVYDFVCEFIKSSGNSTKKLEEFKKVAVNSYKIKTDTGIEEIKIGKVLEKIERSFSSEGNEFGKMSEKFIFSFLCKVRGKNLEDQKVIWSQIVGENSEIQELKEKDEFQA